MTGTVTPDTTMITILKEATSDLYLNFQREAAHRRRVAPLAPA